MAIIKSVICMKTWDGVMQLQKYLTFHVSENHAE